MVVGTCGRGCPIHGRQASERNRQESTVRSAQEPAPSDLLTAARFHFLMIP